MSDYLAAMSKSPGGKELARMLTTLSARIRYAGR